MMHHMDTLQNANTGFYELLLRVRPCQLTDVLKTCLRIHRQRVTTRTNHTFSVDSVSVFGINLLRDRIHEPQMTKLLYTLLRPSDTFLDVGGNEGYFSVIAATLVPNGAVHCIEPQERLQAVLCTNFDLNGSLRAVAHRTALSHADGPVNLFVRPSTNTGASSMFRYWKIGAATEVVPCITLDTFFDKNNLGRVRLMKVDCEGAESLVIAGGREVLRQGRIDFIAMEYHPAVCGGQRCRSTHAVLSSAGYCLSQAGGLFVYHLPGYESDLKALGNVVSVASID